MAALVRVSCLGALSDESPSSSSITWAPLLNSAEIKASMSNPLKFCRMIASTSRMRSRMVPLMTERVGGKADTNGEALPGTGVDPETIRGGKLQQPCRHGTLG